MRKAVTIVMLAAWLTILGSCQLLGCAPQDSELHGCCPKHAAPKVPCPHELLAKAKPAAAPTYVQAVSPIALVSISPISESLHTVPMEARLPNGACAYLRNRVLLI